MVLLHHLYGFSGKTSLFSYQLEKGTKGTWEFLQETSNFHKQSFFEGNHIKI